MSQLQETQQLSISTAESYATFGVGLGPTDKTGVQTVILRTTADCYVDFDNSASSGKSFLIKASDGQPDVFEFPNGNVKTVHAVAASTSGTLYILGIR